LKRLILGLLLVVGTANAAERVISNAMAPYVAGDGRGGFVVSWFEPKAKAVRVATLSGNKWSEVMTIAQGETVKANRADTPTIAADGATIVANYSVSNAHGRNIYVTRSTDGGKSWSKPQMPHPAMASEFGFVSLTSRGDVIWLDGRGLPGGHEGAGDMQFHYTTLKKDGTLAKDETVDARVCDCCPTAMVMTASGPVVAYRDRSDDEVRDISIVRRTASGWSKPKPVHADDWHIKGCPVNGPQLDARGNDVVIAWFTAAQDDPRVNVAFSHDGGATFGAPIRVDPGKPTGRVDVAFAGDGAIVSWVADGALHARRVGLDGTLAAIKRVGEAAGFPHLAVSKENVAVVYGAGDGVRFETVDVPRN
jgi:hypothetical protein